MELCYTFQIGTIYIHKKEIYKAIHIFEVLSEAHILLKELHKFLLIIHISYLGVK